MKKNELLLIVCLFYYTLGFSQNKVWNADTIMKRVVQVQRSDSTREAIFTSTAYTGNTIIAAYTGTLSWKQDRERIQMQDSSGAILLQIIEVRDTGWWFDFTENQVDVEINEERKTGKDTDGLFFFGTNGFSQPKLNSTSGDTIADITLFPIGSQNDYIKVVVRVDLRTYREIGVWIHNDDQSITELRFKYTNINQPIDPSVFLFNPKHYPPGLKVVDSRKE